MFGEKSKNPDFKTFTPPSKAGVANERYVPETLRPPVRENGNTEQTWKTFSASDLGQSPAVDERIGGKDEAKKSRLQRLIEKDERLLGRDRWLARYGHSLTYAGIFLFTLTLYFRPYELIPALSNFSSMALIIAIATLLIYIPTQFSVEGTPTVFTTEVKCILFIVLCALVSIPIAKDPALAWETFNDVFIKVVLIFILMVNTLRTELRIKGLMWLGIGVGILLSYQALDLYQKGVFNTEGYRVSIDFGGMFGNPNDMATHLVIFTPIAVALGIACRNKLLKIVYFTAAGMMTAGSFVTQSRGAFLGLMAVAAVLVWKFGRTQHLKTLLISSIVGILVITFVPGNYGERIMSIFVPGMDASGSSDQRQELLIQSIWVSLRNPLGIGIGNFPIVGIDNLVTHNAYTQVSSEIGVLAFVAYMILLISPLRKLGAIERQTLSSRNFPWIYCLSIGIQASIAGYLVSSFFSSVAYHWYVYYPIAYAIGLRRIYQIAQAEERESIDLSNYPEMQKA